MDCRLWGRRLYTRGRDRQVEETMREGVGRGERGECGELFGR